MPTGPQDDQAAASEKDAVSFDTFSGLRNTVAPERMGPRELARAVNVDLDDAGELRRRRGFRKVVIGAFHSFRPYNAKAALAVKDGVLVNVTSDYRTTPLLAGVGTSPLDYVRIADTIYGSSLTNSFKVDIPTLSVSPWGRVLDHSNYQPGLDPAPSDWWFSPIVEPEPGSGLGPVRGKLLAPPPPGAFLDYYNGRVYVAVGAVLWATELYLYDWVDKTRGYRQYESEITGLVAVLDGLYVGTRDGLFYVQGSFETGKRLRKSDAGVLPGTMVAVPGDVLSPEGRRRPDIPQQAQLGMACMTTEGQMVGLTSGDVYNLTKNYFVFPKAARGSAMYRDQDGMKQLINVLDSGGSPSNNARIGDYCDAYIVRNFGGGDLAGSPPRTCDATFRADTLPPGSTAVPVGDRTGIFDMAGDLIGFLDI